MPLSPSAPAFRHILFPTDGSELSDRAAGTALALARSLGARVTALHVVPPYTPPLPDMAVGFSYGMTMDEYDRAVRAQADQMLARVVEQAGACGVPCDTDVVVDASPWNGIVGEARRRGCDAVVMASHGRSGLAGLVLGSETNKVLTHSEIPVLVTR
jgi:nucleotide-binding universal stress UspA family protein